MRRPLRFIALVLLLLPGTLRAQEGADGPLDSGKPLHALTIDLWTEDDGLPQNMAGAITQTSDGYLWLGMEEGLTRFDGNRFRVFGPENTPAFTTPWVTSLHADDDGTLWIGTNGGGLLRLRDGVFTAYREEDGLAHDHVGALFRDEAGVLWIGTVGGGVTRMTDEGFETLDVGDGLTSDYVLSLAQDANGAIWVGTEDGLNRIDEGGIEPFHRADGLPSESVSALLGTADGSLWVGTVDAGLSRFRDGSFTTPSHVGRLSGRYITSLHQDATGTVWAGSNGGGLHRIRDEETASLTTAGGLPGDLILSLTTGREGGLWLGITGAGLARLHDGIFTVLGRPEGLSSDIALALLEDRDGSAWVGTAGGGLNHVTDRGITTFTSAHGLAHDVILSLAQDDDGAIWVGMSGGGLSRIRDGAVVETFGPEDGLADSRFTDIAVGGDGDLWLGTPGQGLQRWDGTGGPMLTTADGLPSDYVATLLMHSDGSLWVGTRNGVARIEDGEVRPVELGEPGTPSSSATGLYEGLDGTVWVATNLGLGRITDGAASFYGPGIPPLATAFHAVVEDEFGFLWTTTNEGILRFRKADLDALDAGDLDRLPRRTFGRADGLRSAEANGGINPAALRRADGSVWFPTMEGVAQVRPTATIPTRPAPDPILEEVLAGDSLVVPDGSLDLPPEHRSLEFRFTAPTFQAPGEVRFRYRLEGFDEAWVEAGERRSAFYTNLPPGSYRFRVATRRDGGTWNEAEATLPVTLAPRFRETPAFFILVALGLVGLAVGAYRLRVRTLQRRQAELLGLMEEQERTEQALRESEDRLRLALEAGRMGTWEWTPSTGAVTLSPVTRSIFGLRPTSFQELLDGLEPHLSPEDHERLARLPEEVAAGEAEIDLDFPLAAGPDRPGHVEIRGRTFPDDEGRPERVVGVVADISELMRTQSELRQREEELRQSQKMEAVGRLAGGVAHDFNNLLTTILGRTRFLLEGAGEGGEVREDLEEIRGSAERATNLTKQLLTFSRKQIFEPRVVDLNDLIWDVERMLRRLIREDVILETRLDPDLGAVHVDPGGIEQILVNLVVNARDAMPDGGSVVIETANGRPDDGEGPDTHVVLTVSDTGQGMTEETQEQAFDPFFTTKPVGKGTGLGLATVYGIVQQCRGELRLESRPGAGTRFHIFLPRVSRAELAAAGRAEPRDRRGHGDQDGRSARGDLLRGSEAILLVEDDDSVRSLARRILERHGYTVHDLASGLDALKLCADPDLPLDILVSDVVMPEIGGRELAERVTELRPEMSVLLMSGYNEDEVLRRGVRESGMAFLQKPFEATELVGRVRALLDGRPVA